MFTKEADNTRKNNRCANFEALRIVIMFVVVKLFCNTTT